MDSFTCQCRDEACLAAPWRPVKKVSTMIRDPTLRIPRLVICASPTTWGRRSIGLMLTMSLCLGKSNHPMFIGSKREKRTQRSTADHDSTMTEYAASYRMVFASFLYASCRYCHWLISTSDRNSYTTCPHQSPTHSKKCGQSSFFVTQAIDVWSRVASSPLVNSCLDEIMAETTTKPVVPSGISLPGNSIIWKIPTDIQLGKFIFRCLVHQSSHPS